MTWHLAPDPLEPRALGRGRHQPLALILCLSVMLAACSPAVERMSVPASPVAQTVPTQVTATERAPYAAPETTVGMPAPTTLTEGTRGDPAAWLRSQVGATTVVLVDDWKAANDSGQPESVVKMPTP